MSTDGVELRLAEHHFGFYGQALQGDTVVYLDILPPAYLWVGDIPHADPTHWSVYADGELIARIQRAADVGPALLPLLQSAPAKASSGRCNTEQPG